MSESRPVGRVIGVNVRDDELVVRCFGSADASLLHEVLSVAKPEPVGEPAGGNALQDPAEREKAVNRLRSLAECVRDAAKLLPDVPVSSEVVACAGIMGMANWLARVATMLDAHPALGPERCTTVNGLGQRCLGMVGHAGDHTLLAPSGVPNCFVAMERGATLPIQGPGLTGSAAAEVPPPSAAGEEET